MELNGGQYCDVNSIEDSILKTKRDLDQFEEILKRTASGFASVSYLNEKYHAITLGAKSFSQHLRTLRSAAQAPGDGTDARVRARNLHEQAIAQTMRIQGFGRDVRRLVEANAQSLEHAPTKDYEVGFVKDNRMGQQQTTIELQQDDKLAQEMEALESDIVMVNELFTTLATYVHDQGDLVDSIEANTEAAYQQVSSGTTQLATAVKHRKSARRKKCFCIIFFLILLVIIGLAIGLSVRNK